MSNSFVAGARLAASRVPMQKLWTVASTTATSTIGTTETVVITAPSSTYLAGSAYLLSFRSFFRCNVAAATISWTIRDTNASGTTRKNVSTYSMAASAVNYPWYEEHVVANTTASDITGRVLVLTIFSNSGTNVAYLNASAQQPYYLSCYYAGLQTDFPEAVAL